MRPFHWLSLLAATVLTTGCAVYPAAPVAGPPPGVVYDSSAPVAVAPAPYPYYATPYPYPYAYAPGWYGPPVFFSGSLVYRSGPGWHHGFRGGAPSRPNGLRLLPRSVPHR
ncbi:hypothetical protein ACPWT1_10265 [Ramlibacter sp. MMS24-I3-19]|uniref:hypothetical protein n=1 Tax=Ramlibacter sp. MMS24-I3-19 TaxID=3416606 RepID=UPI003D06C153